MTPTQRSSSVPVLNNALSTSGRIAEDANPSIVLRSRNINRPTQPDPRKTQKSPLLLGGSSPISRNKKRLTKPSMLAMAHLMGTPLRTYQAANEDRKDGGSPNKGEDECIITSVRLANCNDTVAGTDEYNSTRLRTSLPSYHELCRTAGVQVNSESADHRAKLELFTVHPAPRKHSMPTVASHVVQDSNGVIAGYMSAMQHSISAVPASGLDEPIPSIETTAPGGNDHLQQLHQHRAAVFGEIIKNSITTTLSTRFEHQSRMKYVFVMLIFSWSTRSRRTTLILLSWHVESATGWACERSNSKNDQELLTPSETIAV